MPCLACSLPRRRHRARVVPWHCDGAGGTAGWSVTVEVTLLHAEVALLGGDRMSAEERLRMLREGPAVDSAQWTPALEQRLVMLERRMSPAG